MTFSVIIPTKDRPAYLLNCIKSIMNQTVMPNDLIIVDASSDEISARNQSQAMEITGDKLKLKYIRSIPGVTLQRNKGAENATGEVYFFQDDDVVLRENCYEQMLEVYRLKKDQNIGGVQGSILNYYNQNYITDFYKKLFFMTRTSSNEKSRFLPSLGYVIVPMPNKIIEVECMSTLLCSYYRKVFNEFKFDTSFIRCTDHEISYRVSKKYRLFQTPYALATHHHSSETHLNIRKLNKLNIIYVHKMVKKHMPRTMLNWLAYCLSVLGELLLSIMKGLLRFDINPVIGTLEGIKHILFPAPEGEHNKKQE